RPQSLGESKRMTPGFVSNVGDEQVRSEYDACGPVFGEAHHQPLDARRKSKPLRRTAADHLRQPVVPASAHDRVLSSKPASHKLKRRALVVVQPSDQPRYDLVVDARFAKQRLEF